MSLVQVTEARYLNRAFRWGDPWGTYPWELGPWLHPRRLDGTPSMAAYSLEHLTMSAGHTPSRATPAAGHAVSRPSVSAGHSVGVHTLSVSPVEDADDGYYYSGGIDASYILLNLGKGSSIEYSGFIRFPRVTIPRNAMILTAVLTVTAYDTQSGTTCTLTVKAEDANDATQVSSDTDADGRSKTAGIDWTVPAMTSGHTYDSPDISHEIQRVVNRSGWNQDNALQLFLINNGSSTNAYRHFGAVDSDLPAVLTVTYRGEVSAGHSVAHSSPSAGHMPGRFA